MAGPFREHREDPEYTDCSLFHISVSLFGSGGTIGSKTLSFHGGDHCFCPFACMLHLMKQFSSFLHKKSNLKLSACFHQSAVIFQKQTMKIQQNKALFTFRPRNTWRHPQDGRCCVSLLFPPPSSLVKWCGCCQRGFIRRRQSRDSPRARGETNGQPEPRV